MKLTYRMQTFLVLALVIGGNILTDAFHHWTYRSIAFGLCGLLYLLNPVVPEQVQNHPKARFWARISGIVLILIGVFTRVHT